MRHVRIVGLCLVAAFAFSAVAAASAMAENYPTFYQCVKLTSKPYTGKYLDKECTKEASPTEVTEGKKNKYEREALGGEGQGLKLEKGKSKKTEINTHGVTGAVQAVECTKDKVAAELYNSFASGKVGNSSGDPLMLTFEKCKGNGSKADVCGNTAPGTITYTAGFGETLWLAAGETKPGLVSVGGVSFKCGSEQVEIEGTLIGTIENGKKGPKIVYALSSGHQADGDFFSEGGEITEFPYTHWWTGEEGKEVETTVEGTEETGAKGVFVY